MKVATTQPFSIVYSLFQHEYLGYLFGSYVVQVNGKGELTLLNQIVSSKNVGEFSKGLDENDFELVKAIDAIQQDTIFKKFNPKKLPALDFFLKVYDPQKGDKLIQEAIAGYIEKWKVEILERLKSKDLYVMGSDGNPAWKKIEWMPERAKVYFHFKRNEENTHYYPNIKYAGERLNIRNQNALLVCDEPAWLLIQDKLYHFDRFVDGKKIRPFLTKPQIIIPRTVEEQYFQRFVVPLVAAYEVYADGFEIKYETAELIPILHLTELTPTSSKMATLFEPTDDDDTIATDDTSQVVLELSFRYGNFLFKFDSFAANANVSLEKSGDSYLFHKVRRDIRVEKAKVLLLKGLGLDMLQGRKKMARSEAFEWLRTHHFTLKEAGIQIRQSAENGKQYFLGYSSIDISFEEGRDWFDIYAKVRFGEFEIPFIKLKNLILARKKEFTLPNGEIAIIPEAWLTAYSELFAFAEYDPDSQQFLLRKHHLALVQEFAEDSLAKVIMSRKLEQLRDFKEIDENPLPEGFVGTLRPYQKAGYDWINFLNNYRFGGCLADDMGLGKTVTTLAMLQYQKEKGANRPSLLVMPTSLLYNWQLEARRFTPQLRVLVYTGTYRDKNPRQFDDYDLILTSYGIVRIDIDMLKNYPFHYIILDESQAIKNPSSHITKAVMQLDARNRLILTGTPLENTTMDLWTQMTFVNPGLLGSQSYFRSHFQVPIEKHNDEKRSQKLYSLIKPFLLRRHKSQVALDLPPKVESVHYCDMVEEQEQRYEETKSYYRNYILEQIEEEGIAKSQIMVLQGLTKLRQLANHPRMIDEEYEGESGKLEEIQAKLEELLAGDHKVLIFSQFIRHLTILRRYLDTRGIRYAYLDGSTTDRQAQVELFQENDEIKIFLISLRAGGLGLNLTAADYVFILDPWWNPAIEAQAIDRAHRIGQQRTVFTYKFITKNSVEEKILDLQRSKQKLFNELITTEESFVKSLTKEDIIDLLA
ncbi:DEAD/DEAH box helicase [Runella salmonicolor]|uniref:DEAD/DEAH box helicase n=1 Tax=Runella salmonicolor TaxID=2950278 RepID=A0ABT1FTZ5_9BACT|nr:DEAD/DEAH box helicase [Runella salmonicolor]MCP1385238.1 DEAD/DEAH box helicase [Runella salmonicolor]